MNKMTGFLEMLLVFGGVLGVLVWQLISLKRSDRESKPNKDSDPPR